MWRHIFDLLITRGKASRLVYNAGSGTDVEIGGVVLVGYSGG